jgi:dihydrodipicolinate synthase/N-acetylneuraminate lyase
MPKQAYEVKFKDFIRMCADAKQQGADVLIVHHPQVLGDNYEEIVESLNRLAEARLKLLILPSEEGPDSQ